VLKSGVLVGEREVRQKRTFLRHARRSSLRSVRERGSLFTELPKLLFSEVANMATGHS
jgi:hypothetical protein